MRDLTANWGFLALSLGCFSVASALFFGYLDKKNLFSVLSQFSCATAVEPLFSPELRSGYRKEFGPILCATELFGQIRQNGWDLSPTGICRIRGEKIAQFCFSIRRGNLRDSVEHLTVGLALILVAQILQTATILANIMLVWVEIGVFRPKMGRGSLITDEDYYSELNIDTTSTTS